MGIIQSEAAEGGAVCSAAMGRLDSLRASKGQTPALASQGAGFVFGSALLTGQGGHNGEGQTRVWLRLRGSQSQGQCAPRAITPLSAVTKGVDFIFIFKPAEIVKYKK